MNNVAVMTPELRTLQFDLPGYSTRRAFGLQRWSDGELIWAKRKAFLTSRLASTNLAQSCKLMNGQSKGRT